MSTKEEGRAASAQRENERQIDRAIDETKKVVQEAKRELPEFTAAFHDYQEENISAIRDITNKMLEVQRITAKSNQAAFAPFNYIWAYPWMVPQANIDMYARIATNFADTAVSATRMSNEFMLASLEYTRNSLRYAKNNTDGVVKLYRENAETAEQLSRDIAATGRSSQTA